MSSHSHARLCTSVLVTIMFLCRCRFVVLPFLFFFGVFWVFGFLLLRRYVHFSTTSSHYRQHRHHRSALLSLTTDTPRLTTMLTHQCRGFRPVLHLFCAEPMRVPAGQLLDQSLTHPLTPPLTHSLTHTSTHPLTHSLTHSPTHSLTHSQAMMTP